MKLFNLIVLFFAGLVTTNNANAQANAIINILTQNTGLVDIGGQVFIQVDIGNTGPSSSIGIYRIKAQISVPTDIVSLPATGHQLPAGWTITNNNGGVLTLSNGTDVIPVDESRTILVAVNGNAVGGPSTVAGVLSFSNGIAPGTGPGILAGDNIADNISQSSIQVSGTLPVTLLSFSASLVNCKPVLNWSTASEVNSDRMEIKRSFDNNNWTTINSQQAAGNSNIKTVYSFIDLHLNDSSDHVFYRLKLIDKDGRFKNSDVLRVATSCKTIKADVFPNPVQNGKLYISLSGIAGYADATLRSISGQVVMKQKLTNGTNVINTSSIANGMYIITIEEKKGFYKKEKIIINK